MSFSLLWIPVTLMAAAAQTARNAMQHQLTARLGTLGATQVRFLFGLPFAALFLLIISWTLQTRPPSPSPLFWAYLAWGAGAQIAATALMLATMQLRHFTLAIATIKTEPVQVALFAWLVLGDTLSMQSLLAIVVATLGVVTMSLPAQGARMPGRDAWLPTLLGLASGAAFALSAVGFRGAILTLDTNSALLAASTTLVWGLVFQSLVLGAWLAWRQPQALLDTIKVWKPSLFAGFMGALASQCWFLGFALTSAANVRTLGLVEVLFAQIASRRVFAQRLTRQESLGLILVVAGVAWLLIDVLLNS